MSQVYVWLHGRCPSRSVVNATALVSIASRAPALLDRRRDCAPSRAEAIKSECSGEDPE